MGRDGPALLDELLGPQALGGLASKSFGGRLDGLSRQPFGHEFRADRRPGPTLPGPMLSPEARARVVVDESLSVAGRDDARSQAWRNLMSLQVLQHVVG